VVQRQDLAVVTVITGVVVYMASLAWLGRGGYQLSAYPMAMLMGNAAYLLAGSILMYSLLWRGAGPVPPPSVPSDGP
jgi:hypothetical protein